MQKYALFGAAAALAISSTFASAADQFTAKITAFNPATGLMILNDRTTLGVDKSIIEGKMEVGATVTVIFQGTENGYEKILKVKIDPPGKVPTK